MNDNLYNIYNIADEIHCNSSSETLFHQGIQKLNENISQWNQQVLANFKLACAALRGIEFLQESYKKIPIPDEIGIRNRTSKIIELTWNKKKLEISEIKNIIKKYKQTMNYNEPHQIVIQKNIIEITLDDMIKLCFYYDSDKILKLSIKDKLKDI